MEEKKKSRTIDQVKVEYSQLCTKAGHTQYQIITLQKELELLNGTLRDLNIEASELSKAPAAAPTQEKKDESQG